MSPSIMYGLATSRGRADCALMDLSRAGFPSAALGALFFDGTLTPLTELERARLGAAGASAGPIRGVMSSITPHGRIAVPGSGAFIVAGTFVAALRNAHHGDVAGVVDGLIGQGVPPELAARWTHRIRFERSILLSIQEGIPDWLGRARAVLEAASIDPVVEPSASPASGVAP